MKLRQSKTVVFVAFSIIILIVSVCGGAVSMTYALVSTSLFEDDFESGSFSEWTGTTTTSGETATVTGVLPHHGNYHGRFTSTGDGEIEYAYCYRTIDEDEVYARGFFYIASGLPLSDSNNRFYFMRFRAKRNSLAGVGITRHNGIDRWVLYGRNGSGWALINTAYPPIEMNCWYSIELHWKKHATQGIVEMYINGEKIVDIRDIETTYFGNADTVGFGLTPALGVQNSLVVHGDCFVVSKTYVGSSLSEPRILGDINLDGSVDILDIVIVALAYGCHPGDEAWNPDADLNNDEVINLFDITIVATRIGEPPDQPPEHGLIVGVDVWRGTTASKFLSRTHLPLMQQCGIQMVRLEFNRDSVSNLRTLVPTVVNNGIKVLGLLIRTDLTRNINAWGDWVYSVVSEFKNYVHVWECWNEPNLDTFFSGADPVKYTSFLKRGYTEAKRADPTCFVLGGSIVFTKQSSLDFLTAMYNSGAKDYMDALAYHPYCTPYSPENTRIANAYKKLETQVRPIMVRNGDGDKKIWITEIGWATDDVTEDQQATYLKQALTMAQDWGWVETFIIYKWIDSTGFYKGLLQTDGSLKPSFNAVKDFING